MQLSRRAAEVRKMNSTTLTTEAEKVTLRMVKAGNVPITIPSFIVLLVDLKVRYNSCVFILAYFNVLAKSYVDVYKKEGTF
jgi:hypothetical protein